MTLLDASALLSLVLGQPAENEVSALIRAGNCAVPGPCLAEVVDKLVRKHKVEPSKVSEVLGPLVDERLPVVATDRRIAWRAGELHAEHYDRKRAPLSLADCVLLATAGAEDDIASSDGVVIEVAKKLGLGVIGLPASDGTMPSAL